MPTHPRRHGLSVNGERSGMPVEPVVDKPPEVFCLRVQAPNLTCPRWDLP